VKPSKKASLLDIAFEIVQATMSNEHERLVLIIERLDSKFLREVQLQKALSVLATSQSISVVSTVFQEIVP